MKEMETCMIQCTGHTTGVLFFTEFCVQCKINVDCITSLLNLVQYSCTLSMESLIWSQLSAVTLAVVLHFS